MPHSHPRPRIFWTPEEFDAIARHIAERFPQCHFEQAAHIDQLNLSVRELLDSVKAALPPARYRTLTNASPMKVSLLAAFARMRNAGQPDQASSAQVRWTNKEWHAVAQTLEQMYPDKRYCSGGNIDELTLAHLNAAALTLPAGRQRYFNGLAGVRERLLEAWRAGSTGKATRPTKIFWTKLEWRTIATELLRLRPELKNDPELITLRPSDLQAAQQVLPRERQRHGLHDMRHNRLALQPAMRDLPATLAPSAPAVSAPPADLLPAPDNPLAAFTTEFEAACRPLADLLTKYLATTLTRELLTQGPALVTQLAPALASALAPLMTVAAQPGAEPPRSYPFLSQQRPAGNTQAGAVAEKTAKPAKPAEAPKAPKPVVGVVGMLPAQQRVLEAAFPEVKLLFVEHDQGGDVVKRLHSCNRVIGMIGFINHSTDGKLHKHFNEGRRDNPRYTRVSGGVTSIKHQIDVWLKTGALYQSQARSVERAS